MSDAPVWQEGEWRGYPRLLGDVRADVCVVGLGGSGLSAVLELLRAGVSVVGVDAGSVAAGAAGRNGGFLLAGSASFYHHAIARYGHERALAIYRKTLDELDRFQRETPDAVRRVGSLRIASDGEELRDCEAQLAAMRADGLAAEPYEGPEGQGLLFPSDAAAQPMRRCRTLAERASALGAQLYEDSPALEISGNTVRTPAGRVTCAAVIVACDGKLERILPELVGRVRTARLQMLATAAAPDVHVPRPVYARWGFEYWQQLPDGRIALGGFRDRVGEAEWTDATTPTFEIQRLLESYLRNELRVGARITHRWAASVAFTTTGLPVVEEVRPHVWGIGGYCGTGNLIGAICGRGAAHLVLGREGSEADVFRVPESGTAAAPQEVWVGKHPQPGDPSRVS